MEIQAVADRVLDELLDAMFRGIERGEVVPF